MSRCHQIARLGVFAAALLLFTGCATTNNQNIYYWGNYEKTLYDNFATPGGTDPAQQIATLTTDIDQAARYGKPVPPGVYAQLGMIYASVGQIGDAMAAFNMEKASFPESAVLIDGMTSRATQQAAK